MTYLLPSLLSFLTLLPQSSSSPDTEARAPATPVGDGQLDFLTGVWQARGFARADASTRVELDALLVLAPWGDGLLEGYLEEVYSRSDLPAGFEGLTQEELAAFRPSHTGRWAFDPAARGWCSLSGWRPEYVERAEAFLGQGATRAAAASTGSDPFGAYEQIQRFESIRFDGWRFLVQRRYGDGTLVTLCQVEAERLDDRVVRKTDAPDALRSAEGAQVDTLLEGYFGSRALAVDDAGTLYLGADRTGSGDVPILARDPDGTLRVVAEGLAPAGLVWRDGHLWVHAHDVQGGRVVRIDREGRLEERGPLPGDPLAVDRDGNAYSVVDDEILQLDGEGRRRVWSRSPKLAGGFALAADDGADALVVGTWTGGEIYRVREGEEPQLVGRMRGSGRGRCAWICLDGDDILGTSFGGSRVYRLSPTGDLSLVAGRGLVGDLDGSGRVARFHNPNGIALAPDGRTLYVSEIRPGPRGPFSDGRLRRIRLPER